MVSSARGDPQSPKSRIRGGLAPLQASSMASCQNARRKSCRSAAACSSSSRRFHGVAPPKVEPIHTRAPCMVWTADTGTSSTRRTSTLGQPFSAGAVGCHHEGASTYTRAPDRPWATSSAMAGELLEPSMIRTGPSGSGAAKRCVGSPSCVSQRAVGAGAAARSVRTHAVARRSSWRSSTCVLARGMIVLTKHLRPGAHRAARHRGDAGTGRRARRGSRTPRVASRAGRRR